MAGDAMAANDVDGLRQKGISYVLTLDSCPLPAHILQQPGIANKYIQGIIEYNIYLCVCLAIRSAFVYQH